MKNKNNKDYTKAFLTFCKILKYLLKQTFKKTFFA